jgi:hypothetical protein
LTFLLFLPLSGTETGASPVIAAGERRPLTGSRWQGWIRRSRAVLPMVFRGTEVDGVAGDKTSGGWRFGSGLGLGLWWFLVEAEG